MQSDEARNLSTTMSSVEKASDWNKMGTTVETDISNNIGDDTNINDGSDAMLKKASHKSSNADNIYDEVDQPPPTSRYSRETDDDEYLDQPLESTMTPVARLLAQVSKGFLFLHKHLYGDKLPPSELARTLCLSSTLFFMIGGYWLLRSLKDPVLTALCGVTAIPKAKMLSVFVVLIVVSVYNRLLDDPRLPKHTLFYIFGMFYFGLFTIISLLLSHPTIGLPNKNPSMDRYLGWVSYCAIESFGSVMVSLFWSFTNSNFNLESAKASYGLLVATAQVGSILGPTVVSVYAEDWGVAQVYFMGALSMLFLQMSMYIYINTYGTEESRNSSSTPTKKKQGAGVMEGLHLFVKHNYVKGIFAISCLFMVEVTIVDYTMKVLARDHFATLHPCLQGTSCWDNDLNVASGMSDEATAAFTKFMGIFGQATNALSLCLSFFGTSAIIRRLGFRLSLLLFPTLCLTVIIVVRFRPTLHVVFAAMMILKANSYALNNPTKEMLYQPTSPAVRYKAKSWIDIFGARGSKGLGSLVTNAFSDSAASLVSNGSLVGMAVASFLIWNANFMGKEFEKNIENGIIVGGEDEETTDHETNGTGVYMAEVQNKNSDTSCGIYEDNEIEDVSDNYIKEDNDCDTSEKELPKIELV